MQQCSQTTEPNHEVLRASLAKCLVLQQPNRLSPLLSDQSQHGSSRPTQYAPGRVTTTELWMQLCSKLGSRDGLRNFFITEFVQLFKISLVFPIDSVDNVRRISLMNLIYESLRIRLQTDHLNTCVRIASSSHTYKTFDSKAAHRLWLQGGICNRYKANR
jgi:hypothetical protein